MCFSPWYGVNTLNQKDRMTAVFSYHYSGNFDDAVIVKYCDWGHILALVSRHIFGSSVQVSYWVGVRTWPTQRVRHRLLIIRDSTSLAWIWRLLCGLLTAFRLASCSLGVYLFAFTLSVYPSSFLPPCPLSFVLRWPCAADSTLNSNY